MLSLTFAGRLSLLGIGCHHCNTFRYIVLGNFVRYTLPSVRNPSPGDGTAIYYTLAGVLTISLGHRAVKLPIKGQASMNAGDH